MRNRNYRTLVLNADYYPLCTVGWKRAIVLQMGNRVSMVDFYKGDSIRDGHGREYPIPAVIASRKYVRRDYHHAPFNRKNVLIRDQLTCQYCGLGYNANQLTVDHVVPRSRWVGAGTSTCWENVVAACIACNRRKANKTCEESGMPPLTKPHRPAYSEMFIGLDRIPAEWLPYLKYLKGLQHHVQETTV